MLFRSLGTTDDLITEKFEVVDYSNGFKKAGEKLNESSKKNIIKINKGIKINIKDIAENIIVKVFDRNCDNIDIIRNKLIYENNKRLNNNDDLIDTNKKINEFLKDDFKKISNKNKNLVKYAVGNKYFDVLKKKYYYNKDNFINACNNAGISNIDTYKSKFIKDNKLPPFEYIDSGFYYDLDPKFNLVTIFANNKDDTDF